MDDAAAGRGWLALAALWGFAEATLFFIVPDVLLTWIGLRGVRQGLVASAACLAGAVAGGIVMYGWGATNAATALRVVERVPAIDVAMIDGVSRSMRSAGTKATFVGPVKGTPYKVYATQAGALGFSLPMFLLVSIPARGIRFAGLTLLASAVSTLLGSTISLRTKSLIHLVVWAAFYAWYFTAA